MRNSGALVIIYSRAFIKTWFSYKRTRLIQKSNLTSTAVHGSRSFCHIIFSKNFANLKLFKDHAGMEWLLERYGQDKNDYCVLSYRKSTRTLRHIKRF